MPVSCLLSTVFRTNYPRVQVDHASEFRPLTPFLPKRERERERKRERERGKKNVILRAQLPFSGVEITRSAETEMNPQDDAHLFLANTKGQCDCRWLPSSESVIY